jgi:oligopeptide transport system substrate-binding protein
MKSKNWIFLVCLALLVGCHTSTSKAKNPPQTLRTTLCYDILAFDPRKGVSIGSQSVVRMIFTGLVRLDEKLQPCLELAESYRISKDFKTYVFTLKECQWSDGSPITAYDFEHTWKAALTPAYSSACTNLFFYIKNGKKAFLGQVSVDQFGVKALDNKTLMVELEVPNPNFLNVLINSIFSPVHESMRYKLPKDSEIICSGPFCLKKHVLYDQIILMKNPNYWNSQNVKLDELHYYIVPDPATALLMFEKKEIDWLGGPLMDIVPESVPSLKEKGILKGNSTAGQQWMFINTDKPPLNNANIRKALAYAIDRKMIMEELLHFEGTPTIGLISKIMKKERWHPWFKDNDVQAAKNAFAKGLEELGLTVDRFPIITISCASATNTKEIQAIQQMWRKNLGIDVHISAVDYPILFSNWYEHNYDITWFQWFLQYNDAVNMLEFFKYKNTPPNCSGWESPEFIKHTDASFSAVNENERWEHIEAAEKIFFDEMPSIPVGDFTAYFLAQPYVKGVYFNYLLQIDFDRASIDLQLANE